MISINHNGYIHRIKSVDGGFFVQRTPESSEPNWINGNIVETFCGEDFASALNTEPAHVFHNIEAARQLVLNYDQTVRDIHTKTDNMLRDATIAALAVLGMSETELLYYSF